MNIEEDVKRILDNDEEIVKMYKPNKKRFVFINFLFSGLVFNLIPIAIFLVGVLGLVGVIKFTTESGEPDLSQPVALMIFGGIGVIFLIVACISFFVRYKKAYYFVTNKRLIIRGGFIGADYKSLPLSTVGMLDVRVDFLDKLVKNNTGTIIFGSASTPVVNQQQQMMFAFHHIDDPYGTYKEIKEIVSSKQNEKVS